MTAQSNLRFIATCVPGAEAWLRQELLELRVTTEAVDGGVEGRAPLSTIRQLLARARLPESVRVRATRPFAAHNFAQLNEGLSRVPWHAYLVSRLPVDVRVVCKRSTLYHSDAVAERVREAVRLRTKCDFPVAQGLSVQAHCNRIHVRLLRDQVQVSFDAGGEALHRRGYRRHVGEAPLRETLAALLLRLTQNLANGQVIPHVWDPCAGSGTIPLEWLCARLGLLPQRPFLMDEWPCFGEAAPQPRTRLAAAEVALPDAAPLVTITDISSAAVEAARANAQELGTEQLCRFQVGDLLDVESHVVDGTAVVTNLPYGVRLGSQRQASALLHKLDAFLSRRRGLRPAVVLWGGGALPSGLQGSFTEALRFRNGGRPVSVLVKR